MKTKLFMYLALCCILVFTLGLMAGCKGSDGAAGPQGPAGLNGANGTNGTNGTNGLNGAATVNINSLSADDMANFKMTGTITSITMSANPVVKFTVTDSIGRGVVGLGTTTSPTSTSLNYLHVAIAYLSTDATDSVTNAWTNYYVNGNAPANEGVAAGIVDNGDGSYVYTFQKAITGTIDMTATHRVVVQISGNVPGVTPTDPIVNPLNIVSTFVPNGNAVTATRDIISETACNGCHTKIGDTRLDWSGNRFSTPGHGGRIDLKYCVLCHTSQNFSSPSLGVSTVDTNETLINPLAPNSTTKHSTWLISNGTNTYNQLEFVTMIHKTHMGENLTLQNYEINADHYYPNEIGYPQDIRNCTRCHDNTNTKTPDADNWKNKPSMKACGSCHDNISWSTSVPQGFVAHSGGTPKTDSQCALCHTGTGDATNMDIVTVHSSDYATAHNAGVAGAANFKYIISKVTVSTDHNTDITFSITNNGTTVALNPYSALTNTTTLINGFSGGPSLLVQYAVPEDGVQTPADWNSGHDSLSLLDCWSGAHGNTLTDNGNGTYTCHVIASTTTSRSASHPMAVPTNATMVTGAMAGAFTQLNWASLYTYPTDTIGATRPGIADFRTADGYTARRKIVDPARCNTCHEQLGTDPNFHGGNYNVAMCAMCHTPNQASSGWSASFRVWVHGIHGASKRTVPFTWHAASPTDGFYNLLYPGILNACEQCHLPGTYDFSDTGASTGVTGGYSSALIANMLNVADVYSTLSSTSTSAYQYSPYVTMDYNYGSNYTLSTDGSGSYTNGASTNLVSSPITATCSACHDSTAAIDHMTTNGGLFYAQRPAVAQPNEACLVCHGKGAIEDIKTVHQY